MADRHAGFSDVGVWRETVTSERNTFVYVAQREDDVERSDPKSIAKRWFSDGRLTDFNTENTKVLCFSVVSL